MIEKAIFQPNPVRDEQVAWHYGDPFAEQRLLAAGRGFVDFSNRSVIRLTGPDALGYLNSLTTQKLNSFSIGDSALTLNLSPQGFVLDEIRVTATEAGLWLTGESERGSELFSYLTNMRFRSKVEVVDETANFACVWSPSARSDYSNWTSPFDQGGFEFLVPRNELEAVVGQEPVGTWAYEAWRVAARIPRLGVESDHHTLPHELGWIGPAVHLNKGCYRGQETVSKVERMGQPPRRLIQLLLDGSEDLPSHGAEVKLEGASVGWIGTAVQHYELGPIASAVVKRTAAEETTFNVDGRLANRF